MEVELISGAEYGEVNTKIASNNLWPYGYPYIDGNNLVCVNVATMKDPLISTDFNYHASADDALVMTYNDNQVYAILPITECNDKKIVSAPFMHNGNYLVATITGNKQNFDIERNVLLYMCVSLKVYLDPNKPPPLVQDMPVSEAERKAWRDQIESTNQAAEILKQRLMREYKETRQMLDQRKVIIAKKEQLLADLTKRKEAESQLLTNFVVELRSIRAEMEKLKEAAIATKALYDAKIAAENLEKENFRTKESDMIKLQTEADEEYKKLISRMKELDEKMRMVKNGADDQKQKLQEKVTQHLKIEFDIRQEAETNRLATNFCLAKLLKSENDLRISTEAKKNALQLQLKEQLKINSDIEAAATTQIKELEEKIKIAASNAEEKRAAAKSLSKGLTKKLEDFKEEEAAARVEAEKVASRLIDTQVEIDTRASVIQNEAFAKTEILKNKLGELVAEGEVLRAQNALSTIVSGESASILTNEDLVTQKSDIESELALISQTAEAQLGVLSNVIIDDQSGTSAVKNDKASHRALFDDTLAGLKTRIHDKRLSTQKTFETLIDEHNASAELADKEVTKFSSLSAQALNIDSTGNAAAQAPNIDIAGNIVQFTKTAELLVAECDEIEISLMSEEAEVNEKTKQIKSELSELEINLGGEAARQYDIEYANTSIIARAIVKLASLFST